MTKQQQYEQDHACDSTVDLCRHLTALLNEQKDRLTEFIRQHERETESVRKQMDKQLDHLNGYMQITEFTRLHELVMSDIRVLQNNQSRAEGKASFGAVIWAGGIGVAAVIISAIGTVHELLTR